MPFFMQFICFPEKLARAIIFVRVTLIYADKALFSLPLLTA